MTRRAVLYWVVSKENRSQNLVFFYSAFDRGSGADACRIGE